MANQTEKRDVIITLSSGQALSSIKEMEIHMRKLRKELKETNDEGKRGQLAAEMKNINAQLQKQYALTKVTKSGFEQISGTIMKMGGLIAGMMGFQIITEQVGNLIRKGAELSDSMADVQKTTGLTEKQVKQLDESLRKIDTRTSRKELLELARDAGKLGKSGTAEIKKFVEQADMIKVALGEDLGEGALIDIGKLSNIFKADMLQIASAINTVGASSEASEPALVEFLNRLGGIATTANLSAPDIIGYGATLDALGLKAEMSTTALNTFFIDFIKNSEEMGRVAGFAAGELSNLIGAEGTNAGFVAFLEKLKETHPEQKQFLQALEQMGIDGARGSQVFLTLANNTEMLRKQQDIANKSYKEGTSVIDEFNVKNNNFAANLNRIQKELGHMFTSGALMRGIEAMVNGFADYLKQPISEKLASERAEMQSLVTRIELAKDNQKLRNKTVQELIDKYPAYFGHLQAESASLEDISKAMRKVNEDYKSRIKLALRQEELQEIQEEGLRLAKKEEDALAILEIKKQLASKNGARGYEDLKTARENLNQATAALAANEEKYLKVMGEVDKLQQKETERTTSPLGTEGDDILAELDRLIALKSTKTDELTDKEAKAIKAAADATKKLIQELEDAKIAAIDNVEIRERQAADAAYERKRQEILDTTANEDVKKELIAQLWRDTEQKKIEISAEAFQLRLQAEADAIAKANDSELLTLQLKVDVADENSREQFQALINLLMKQMEFELESIELTQEQKLLIIEDYENRVDDIKEQYRVSQEEKTIESLDKVREKTEETINGLSSTFGEIFSTISQGYDLQIEKAGVARDEQLAILKDQLQKGLISESTYKAKEAELNQKYEAQEREAKRKQFGIDKAANIVKATMAMALAITTAMSGGPIVGQVLAGITAVLAGVQIGMIAAQPNPYLEGGYTDITDTQGNKHRAKNIGSFAENYGYYSTPSYGVVAEDGKPELVIPNHVLENPTYSDAVSQIESAIYRQNTTKPYKKGGYTSSSTANGKGDQQSLVQKSAGSADMQMVMSVIQRNSDVIDFLMRNGVIAKFEWDSYRDGVLLQEKIDGKHYFNNSDRRSPGKEP